MKCIKGHEWTAVFYSIKNGKTWHPTCSDTRFDISVAKELAHSKNGKCLSEKYINSKSPLLWCCNKRHEWYASLYSVKNKDTWCPHCMGVSPHNLEDARQIAYSKNGKCFSTEYKNLTTKLLWSCVKGHKWFASFSGIKNQGTWCPYCAGNVRYTLEVAKQIAFNRNGECLSTEYINTRSDLLWGCTNRHLWNAPLWNIKVLGTWCPFCKNKREELCREIVIKYLGLPSNIRRPDFLKTYDYPLELELDIYYPEYGFAIEVQGQRHEKYIEFFHRNPKNFIKQQNRDQQKKVFCEEIWIVLRYVWYYEDPYIVIPEHLRELDLIE
ncbi:hypothetical protein Glove_510g12 [Diversispora epigaea]|uniref:Zinc-ribbon domain-containing protein n=1 Tax=Diversispora epigaea TaxID=1348612 RepID=A0A397GL99_9GLOM|nr:hypothetical protein Glove_510g12 [Diversispora epigaea]